MSLTLFLLKLSKDFNFGRLDCAKMSSPSLCVRYQISKYPTFVLFKSLSSMRGMSAEKRSESSGSISDWYEIHYGNRQSPEDLASFVKENAYTQVRTLTEFDVTKLSMWLADEHKQALLVDFFAPWCPPCMSLLPEFRKASTLDSADLVAFATVDCAINQRLCEQYNVFSYPTTMLYNGTTPHSYHGQHNAHEINDFIQVLTLLIFM
jgi:DnaJ homolog subfamily C member 10